jgi:hypothetical protein
VAASSAPATAPPTDIVERAPRARSRTPIFFKLPP